MSKPPTVTTQNCGEKFNAAPDNVRSPDYNDAYNGAAKFPTIRFRVSELADIRLNQPHRNHWE
jgi:polyisoprenoid-binding protein YceI